MPEAPSGPETSADLSSLFKDFQQWQRLPEELLERLANYLERGKSSGTLRQEELDFLIGMALQLRHLSYSDLSRLCDVIEIAAPGDQKLEKLKFQKLFTAGKHERAADLVISGKLTRLDEDILKDIGELDVPDKVLAKLLDVLAKYGIFPEALLWELFKSPETHTEKIAILEALKKAGKVDLCEDLAEEALKREQDPEIFSFVLTLLRERNKTDELDSTVKLWKKINFSSVQQVRVLIETLVSLKMFDQASQALDRFREIYKDDYTISRSYATVLIQRGDVTTAYEILKDLASRNALDRPTQETVIKLAFDQKLYEECLSLVSANPQILDSVDVNRFRIQALLETGKFEEAKNAYRDAAARFTDNLQIRYLGFLISSRIGNKNEAYETAKILAEKGVFDDPIVQYLISWYSEISEHDLIVELLERNQTVLLKYADSYVSSLLKTKNSKKLMKFLGEYPAVLQSPGVIDQIGFLVRSDEILNALEDIIRSSKDMDLLRDAVLVLRGAPRISYQDLQETHSRFLEFYAFAASRFSRTSSYFPPMNRLPENKEVITALNSLSEVERNGRARPDILDYPQYMFPLSRKLVEMKLPDAAIQQLSMSPHDENDPFYNYLKGRVELIRDNYQNALKHSEKSVETLFNFEFAELELICLIFLGETKQARKLIERLSEKNQFQQLDFRLAYETITNKNAWVLLDAITDELNSKESTDPWLHRLLRDLYQQKGKLDLSLQHSSFLFRTNQYADSDVDRHVDILKSANKQSEVLPFLQDMEIEAHSPKISIRIAHYFYEDKDYRSALKAFRKAFEKGADLSSDNKFVRTLIETGNVDEAERILEGHEASPEIMIRIYQKRSRIPEVLSLLEKYKGDTDSHKELYRHAAETLWYNTDVRDFLVNLFKETGAVWLGKVIVGKAFDNGDKKMALEICDNLLNIQQDDIEIRKIMVDLLVKSGNRNEAIETILKGLKYYRGPSDAIEMINVLFMLYFEDRDYDSIIRFYETNPTYVDSRNLQFVIRSYIEKENFSMAERLLSRYEGTILSKDTHQELLEDLKFKKDFLEITLYVSRLLKAEYKAGKVFNKQEAFYKANIPIERIEDVYNFLESRDFYYDINEEKYELLSRDVIQKAVKSSDLESVRDLKINVIYNNLERKDPIIARNLYLYIQDQLETARAPKLKNAHVLKQLKLVLKEKVKPELLHVAYYLKTGISEALDVLSLMNYMSKMDRERFQ
ncbi:MAG TPA: hypothetical protein VKU79_07675 [Thermoplasmataceae archaeon]|nr:hypothetical protein [Thermoplasmataceae archaeon]